MSRVSCNPGLCLARRFFCADAFFPCRRVGRWLADCWPAAGQLSACCRPAAGWLLHWPSLRHLGAQNAPAANQQPASSQLAAAPAGGWCCWLPAGLLLAGCWGVLGSGVPQAGPVEQPAGSWPAAGRQQADSWPAAGWRRGGSSKTFKNNATRSDFSAMRRGFFLVGPYF